MFEFKREVMSRGQLSRKYKISDYQWKRHHDRLIDYLSDYFREFDEKRTSNGAYVYTMVLWEDGEWPEIPKFDSRAMTREEKEKYFDELSIKCEEILPTEFAPQSKARAARFCQQDPVVTDKFNLFNENTIAYKYIGAAMEKNGVKSEYKVWVNKQYEELSDEELSYLRDCFAYYGLTDAQKLEEYDNILDMLRRNVPSKEILDSISIDSYMNAVNRFETKYRYRPIRVYKWMLDEKHRVEREKLNKK